MHRGILSIYSRILAFSSPTVRILGKGENRLKRDRCTNGIPSLQTIKVTESDRVGQNGMVFGRTRRDRTFLYPVLSDQFMNECYCNFTNFILGLCRLHNSIISYATLFNLKATRIQVARPTCKTEPPLKHSCQHLKKL